MRVKNFQKELEATLKPTDIQICMYDNWNKQFKVCVMYMDIHIAFIRADMALSSMKTM